MNNTQPRTFKNKHTKEVFILSSLQNQTTSHNILQSIIDGRDDWEEVLNADCPIVMITHDEVEIFGNDIFI